jgi:peptidoglycan hydrolase-like protein with peptidoglycan-binding domain
MSPATRSVVRSFQQREKLPVSGIVGPDTEEALKRACSGGAPQASDDTQADQELAFETPFEYGESAEWRDELDGSTRDQVRWAQRSLNEVLGVRLFVDGMRGPATRSAIRSFQRQQGLPVTGMLEAETDAALREVRRDAETEVDAILELETLGPLTAELKWLPENAQPKLYSLQKALLEPGGGVYIALNKNGTPLKVGVTNSFATRLRRYGKAAQKIGGVWFYLAQIKRGRIGGSGIAGADKAIEYAIARTLLRAGRGLRWHGKPFAVAAVTDTVDIRNILPKPLASLVSKAFTASGKDPRQQPIRTYPAPSPTEGLRLLKSKHPEWEAWSNAAAGQAG